MIAVQVALSLTALTAIVAVAVDGGILLAERRHAQATADAAALAAAADLLLKWNTNGGVDGGTASTSALNTATSNGYANDGSSSSGSGNSPNSSTVVVRLNPAKYLGGPNAGTTVPKGYAEVTVTYYQGRYFSSVFGSGTVAISARAVARGGLGFSASPAVLVLDPSGSGAITDKGGGNSGGMTVTGGSVVVNSSSSSAITTTGGATLTAKKFVVTGGYGSSTLVTSPTANQITTGAVPTADPFLYLPVPAQPAKADWYTQNGIVYVPPGAYGIDSSDRYNNLDNIGNNSTVDFVQASAGLGNVIYIGSGVTGGGFSSNNTTYQMDPATSGGVMIYNASSNGLSMGGNSNSSFTLTAPTSGIYQGIAYFQARNSTGTLTLGGNGSLSVTGTVYAPNASVSFGGNGSAAVTGQLIVQDLSMNGNGNTSVTYSAGSAGQGRFLQLVE
jgi:Flp pilus assembly protein TadG